MKSAMIPWMKRYGVVLGSAALLSVLSVLFIGSESMWVDEVYSIRSAVREAMFTQIFVNDQGRMALYSFFLHFWLRLGQEESVIRLLSLVFAVATLPVLHAVAKRLFNPRVADFAAILFALNPFVIHYAQEARGYTVFLFFAVLSMYFFVRYLDQPSGWMLTGWITVSILGLYSHFFQLGLLAVQMASLPFRAPGRGVWRGSVAGCALTLAFFLPVPFLASKSGITGVDWIVVPGVRAFYDAFRQFTGSLPALVLVYVPLGASMIAGAIPLIRGRGRGREMWSVVLPFLWLILPLVGTMVGSYLFKPMFVPRYLIFVVPALVIIGAVGFERLRGPVRVAAIGLALVLTTGRTVAKMYLETDNEQWREATSFVLSQSRSDDAALFYAYFTRIPYEYYVQRYGSPANGPRIVDVMTRDGRLPFLSDMPPPDSGVLGDLHNRYPRVWVLLCHDFEYLNRGKDRELIRSVLGRDYRSVEERRYNGIVIQLFERSTVGGNP